MTEVDLKILLKKYRQGTATPAERYMVEKYYDAFELRPNYTDVMDKQSLDLLETSLKPILDTPSVSPPEQVDTFSNRQWTWAWYVSAAMVVLMIGATVWFNFLTNETPSLSSSLSNTASPEHNRYQQLPDGSIVVLTESSTIEFLTSFKESSTREIKLIGEAYFDVVPDLTKPFIVHAGHLTTKVLGTSFAIKNDQHSSNVMVKVFTGKVQVNHQQKLLSILTPNTQLIYDPNREEDTHRVIEDIEKSDWFLDDLYCDDITVAQACAIIEKRYDVQIEVQGQSLQQKRFTTTFLKDESLEAILHSVTVFNDATFKKLADRTHSKPYYILSPLEAP